MDGGLPRPVIHGEGYTEKSAIEDLRMTVAKGFSVDREDSDQELDDDLKGLWQLPGILCVHVYTGEHTLRKQKSWHYGAY